MGSMCENEKKQSFYLSQKPWKEKAFLEMLLYLSYPDHN